MLILNQVSHFCGQNSASSINSIVKNSTSTNVEKTKWTEAEGASSAPTAAVTCCLCDLSFNTNTKFPSRPDEGQNDQHHKHKQQQHKHRQQQQQHKHRQQQQQHKHRQQQQQHKHRQQQQQHKHRQQQQQHKHRQQQHEHKQQQHEHTVSV
ncbi:hypothetical protein FHG87_019232 [Trinorchestia longiramus]|nr:hypothetical protein FHG87_019232 [Trinorchestia longiramus]